MKKCNSCRRNIRSGSGRNHCNTCISRKKRSKNPIRYAYDNLKHNCYRRKGRGFFELTFDEFKKFAIETNYIVGKGIAKTSYSIDRIDNTMGYFIRNIRVVENQENSRKHTKVLNYDWQTKWATVTDKYVPQDDGDNPF